MEFMELYYIAIPYIESVIYSFFGLVTLYCLYIAVFEKNKIMK